MRATWRGIPARRHKAGWEPGLKVPAADGSPLRTDHYFPRAEGDFPTLLVRSPYGRGLPWSPLFGVLFAEQGFHVVLQSCRGTGGSGGRFDLWRNEPADGRATVSWLREQPWFNGRLGTIGPSYLGYVQWALAADPPPELKAMVIQIGLHDPHAFYHAGGALHLENALVQGLGMTYQHQGLMPFVKAVSRLQRGLRAITTARPLRRAYVPALGEVPWLDDALAHPDADDPHWDGASLAEAADGLSVPTSLIAGWHDALLDRNIEQYHRLRRAGCATSLLVGPWTHTSALGQGWPEVFAESLAWLRAHLCDDASGLRPTRVRVHVGGAGEWDDLDDWPPPLGAVSWIPGPDGSLTRGPDGSLAREPEGGPASEPEAGPASDSASDSASGPASSSGGRLTPESERPDIPQPATDPPSPLASILYDPADPTPSLGGPLLSRTAGPRDNRELEARGDVLTFTSPPLAEPVDVRGPVSARLRISTDTGHADVFARLCDVDARGRSRNVCDGLSPVRTTGETSSEVTVPMSSTVHRFAAGHRVRLQVSGGAHPRFARDPGTGEPSLDATRLVPVRITLYAGSALRLPAAAAESGDPWSGERASG
ncbi:CocE/NonD family hydrolase [Streptomyces sp. NPDC003077]|uniref:CocE/NonD family hydrolase n=1 Tax=Streptomyces sp. NPDC003077 TaxID=3154443 RepID=UPI0033BCD90A